MWKRSTSLVKRQVTIAKEKIGSNRVKIGKTCFRMSKDIHSENLLDSLFPLKFKRTGETQAAQTTADILVKYT